MSDSRLQEIFGPQDSDLARDYAALAELIADNHRFLVVAHLQPDGDALASTLALCHLLWSLGKEAVPFNVDPAPFNFAFLDGADKLQGSLPEDAHFDCTVVLDCAQPERVGANFPAQGWGDKVAVIDHHQTWDPDFAQVYVRDTGAAAVGEMIYRLGLVTQAPTGTPFDRCCYASIVSDTGGFRYGKTSKTTFRIASDLVDRGVNPWDINSNIYENEPLARLRLLSRVLDTLTLSSCGRLAFLTLDQDMIRETGVSQDMIDGFINYARSVRGVEVAIQMREVVPGRYRLSFRSRGRVNVASLAEAFGGGGHKNAAGCEVQGDAATIQRQLADRLHELLENP
jgi:phosphoesterase RecJ-like protein